MNRKQIRAIFLVGILLVSVISIGGIGAANTPTNTQSTSVADVSGTLTYADGTAVAGWKILAYSDSAQQTTQTNSSGSFSLTPQTNTTYNVYYQQFNHSRPDAANYPRDGRVDIHPLGAINPTHNKDVGTHTIPNGSLLNVIVKNQTGHPIPNATVHITQTQNNATAYATGHTNQTGTLFIAGSTTPGIELTGTIELNVNGPGAYNDTHTTLHIDTNQTYTVTLEQQLQVTGTITSTSGDAVPNSTVILANDSIWQDTPTTNTGGFSLTVPDAGEYTWRFRQDPTPQTAPADNIPDFYPLGSLTIQQSTTLEPHELPAANNLTVVVTDPTGTPLPNTTVHISQQTDDVYAGDSFTTNETGVITVEVAENKETFIDVETPQANLTGAHVERVLTTDTEIDIELSRAVTITGSIQDATGQPAANVTTVYHTDTYSTAALTGPNGIYTLSVPANDTYHIDLRQNDPSHPFPDDGVPGAYAYGFKSVTDTNETQSLSVPYGHDFNLTVVGPNNQPLPGLDIDITHIQGDRGTTIDGTTNQDGEFVPRHAITPGIELNGTIYVEISTDDDSGLVGTEVEYEISSNQSEKITLSNGVAVTGELESAHGLSVTGWSLTASPQTPDATGFHTLTQSNGAFTGVVSENTTFHLAFRQRDHESTTPNFPNDGIPDLHPLTTFTTTTQNLDLSTQTLPEAHLVNITVQNQTGAPLADVPVQIGVEANGHTVWMPGRTTETGHVQLRGATTPGIEANGVLHIDVSPTNPAYGPTSAEYTVDENRSVTVTVQPALTITGTVHGPDDQPISGERVLAYDPTHPGDTAWTNQTGSFTLKVAEPGTYETGFIQVAEAGDYEGSFPQDGIPDLYAFGHANATSNAFGTIQLPDAHNLTVTVVNESGDPLPNTRVYLTSLRDGVSISEPVTTNANGTISAELAGTIAVQAAPREGGYIANGTTLTLTNDSNIQLMVQEGVLVKGQLEYSDGTSVSGWHISPFGGPGEGNLTTSDGYYSISVAPNNSYDLAYKQTDWAGGKPDFPKDGWADLYAFSEISVGDVGALHYYEVPRGHLVNITVVNTNGTVLSGLEADVVPINGDASGHHPAYTNSAGELVLDGAQTPGIEASGTLRIHIPQTGPYSSTVRTLNVTNRSNVTIVMHSPATITGTVVYPDTTTHAGDVVVTFGGEYQDRHRDSNITSESGQFSVTTPWASNVDLQFYQGGAAMLETNSSVSYLPRDGVVDVYALTRLNVSSNDRDVGNLSVPTGHVVNVTVRDESGDPVRNATIEIGHFNGAFNSTETPTAGLSVRTDPDGQLHLGGRPSKNYSTPPGIELTGNISIRVYPPANATRFTDQSLRRNISVNSTRNLTFTLEEQSAIHGQFVNATGSPLSTDLAVAANEGFNINITDSTGYFTVTGSNTSQTAIVFGQRGSNGSEFPRDGVTDLYETTIVPATTAPVSIGQQSIPDAAGILNIRVVDENGDPVENATVALRPEQTNTPNLGVGWGGGNGTDSEGYWISNLDGTRGIEANGTYLIQVQPPVNSTRFENQPVNRTVNVTGDTTVRVELGVVNQSVGVDYTVNRTTVPRGNPVNVTATVTNSGSTTVSETVELSVSNASGVVRTVSKTVSVSANDTAVVSFSEQLPPGSYDVTINDLAPTIVTVTDSIDVTVQIPDSQIGVSQTTAAHIVVTNVTDGIGAFNLNVTLGNTTVGTLTQATVPLTATTDITVADDGSRATLAAYNASTTQPDSITIATIQINATTSGTTPVTVTIESIGTESGQSYHVGTTTNASLTAVSVPTIGDFTHHPTDPDNDGVYEDVNGDGEVNINDVQALFQNRGGPTPTKYHDAFDYNNDGTFDIVDIQYLFAQLTDR